MSEPPRYLIIGRVLKPWGVHGEIKVEILTQFPDRFASLRQVVLGEDATIFVVEHARLHGKGALVKLKGIDTPEAAAPLRNQLVQVAREDAVPLPKGQLYLYEILGLDVRTVDGQALGRVTEVIETGANDVYVVDDGTRQVLIPAIEDVVKEISLERHEIVITLIDGLI
jgi:16S rRNA processing protein RimM